MKGLVVAAWVACLAACAPPRVELEPAPAASGERLVIDTRDPAEFAAGHLPGALNLQWSWDQLGARIAAYVPDRATPLAVRGSTPAEAERAAAVLQEHGYTDVTLPPPGAETETLGLLDARALRAELAGPAPPLVVDVRTAREFERGTIPGALLVDQDDAPKLLAELDRARRIAVICEGGWRSSQLASLLRRNDFPDVVNVIDGMAGWRALK
jgi:rhodanese-related sulfurtransferase